MRPFALLLLLLPLAVSAQGTGTLYGRVVDDVDMGLPGAYVVVDGTTLRVQTDVDGNYRIAGVPLGKHAVTASFTGWDSVTRVVTITDWRPRWVQFVLPESPLMDDFVYYECYRPLTDSDAFASRVVTNGPSGWACGFPVGLADLPVER